MCLVTHQPNILLCQCIIFQLKDFCKKKKTTKKTHKKTQKTERSKTKIKTNITNKRPNKYNINNMFTKIEKNVRYRSVSNK